MTDPAPSAELRYPEQGPIRPPSEASSLLLRVSRNCPWNRCAFCPVYEGERFSLRTADEVIADLEALRRLHGDGPRTLFLQDANPLLTRPAELVRILDAVRRLFPQITRVTTYARAHTVVRRSLADLQRIRQAGLHRLHIGLESGCDEVLSLMQKGVTRAEQIEAGCRAKQAGFELSEYVMPGLGGRRLSQQHAEDTASALAAIEPDFIRLRTATILPGTELDGMQQRGEFEPLGEVDTVREIRRMLVALGTTRARIESDHMMNLLMELRGDLPGDRQRLIEVCDRFLDLPPRMQIGFVLGRRVGMVRRLAQIEQPEVRDQLDQLLSRAEAEAGVDDDLFGELRGRII